jgi:hypothetical protein
MALSTQGQPYLRGGAEFMSAEEITAPDSRGDAWEDLVQDYPKDARFWRYSLPLIPLGNGDFVALYTRDNPDDPPVCYLCHDGCGGSGLLASSFDTFLTAWEQLGYLDLNAISVFTNPDTGLLEPDAFPVEREAIHAIWRGESRPDLVKPAYEMTEAKWNACRQPETLLNWLEQKGMWDERKLRLFNCALCRRVWDQMGEWSQHAVTVAEEYADGKASAAELEAARTALAGGERGHEVDQAMFPGCGSFNPSFLLDLAENPEKLLENGPFMELLGRFGAGLGEAMAFSKSQGKMHQVAYSAINSRDGLSASWHIAENLDEPELTLEKISHAELARHIFGNPFRPVEQSETFPLEIERLAKRLYDGGGSAADLREALQAAGFSELAEHFLQADHPKGCWALDLILRK